MKLLLGLTLPSAVREEVQVAYEELREDYPYFAWEPSDNYLVTIAQLGERSEEKMPLIREAIEQSIFDVPPTRLFSSDTNVYVQEGIILRLKYARNKEIEKIRESVIDLFSASRENKTVTDYLPETVIARSKLPSKQQYFHLRKKLAKIEVNVEFTVNEVHLFEVITKPTNSEYEILHTFELVE